MDLSSAQLPMTILVAGDPVPTVRASHGSFDQHVRQTVGSAWPGPWVVVDIRTTAPPPVAEVAAVVVTGSASSVTERAHWMLRTEEFLRSAVAANLPVLGLCFGHQLLGQALGGEVQRNPNGFEIGTVPLEVTGEEVTGEGDSLVAFGRGAPDLRVNMTHEDSVVRLPSGAKVLARTRQELHAAIHYGGRAWGLQFHPEFDGAILRGYIVHGRQRLLRQGADADALVAAASDTPWSAGLLPRFARLAREQSRSP